VNEKQITDLLLQSLEAEIGGTQIYETAVTCAINPDLKQEWETYLDETRRHVEVLTTLCEDCDIDPEDETPGRLVVRHIGQSLVQAMEMALQSGDPSAAQLVACECVVFAETKDHSDWELIGQCAKKGSGPLANAMRAAYEDIEEEEDSHLYHSKGWCRELWIEALGLDPVLPPPEEVMDVKTAIGAARAQASVRAARRIGDTEP
jgi:rubrerythrin